MKHMHFVAATSAIVIAAMLAGCSENEQLEACAADIEPTLLLRQLNLDGATKAKFGECVAHMSKFGCQASYLDRKTLMAACMKRNGFALATPGRLGCLFEPADDPECFRPKWQQGMRSLLASD
jgi:hypothetical protein